MYKLILPDTMVWSGRLAYTQPYVTYYFRHPSYVNYPVVGVSYEQASQYCNWLTEKYLREENRKYKKVKFRLPKLNEWAYAASGGTSQNIFPWEGNSMKDNKENKLANFVLYDQRSIVRLPDSIIKGEKLHVLDPYGSSFILNDVTFPVESFSPNDYGLFCMAGNIEEFVAEEGYSKGGSYRDPGYYLQNYVHQTYEIDSSASNFRGFRFAMEIVD